MAISIRITGDIVGEGVLYSGDNKTGKRHAVPLYRMILSNKAGTERELGVTRDTLVTVGKKQLRDKYGLFGECPPNKNDVPYEAFIRTDGERGFRLQLYESAVSQPDERYLLQGVGNIKRQYIQIHIGPGQSRGCFLLTDDEAGRGLFQSTLEELIEEEKKIGGEGVDAFIVYVEGR